METVSLQRASRAGSEDEGLLPRLQSLGEHGPRPASGLAVLRDRRCRATDTRGDPSAEPWADTGVVESLTIEIFGETLGLNSDASIWRYACDHLRDWFPGLGTEWNFVRRCANLCWLNVQDALFHPSRDWNAFFRCRCASTHGRGGISGSGARLRRPAGEVLRLQGADELGRGDLPVVAGAPGQKPRHGSERNYLWRPTLPSRCLSA